MTYKFTDIFTCDLVAHVDVKEWVVVTLVGKKSKPNTLPLSMECINIKFDSLAASLLPFAFVLTTHILAMLCLWNNF